MLPPPRIAVWVVILVAAACTGSMALLGVSVTAVGLAAAIHLLLAGTLFSLQCLTHSVRWFLPERRGLGLASLAAIVYWGIGWVLPSVTFAVAVDQQRDLGWAGWAVVAVSAVVLAMAAYSLLLEPCWWRVRRLELACDDLPADLAGTRILHLSDLHLERPGKRVNKLAKRIASLTPDLICITGDLANDCRSADAPGVEAVNQLLRRTKARWGTFVVYGDWDGHGENWPDVERRMFAETGTRVLEDELMKIEAGDASLVIMGRSPAHRNAKPNYMAQLSSDGFSIVLHHYPFGAMRAAEVGADLYLAGHTHGGQLRVPAIGSLYWWTRGGRDRRGKVLLRRFQSGLHRIGKTWSHISAGLGMRGGDAPRIRLFCRPEMVLLVLQRAASHTPAMTLA